MKVIGSCGKRNLSYQSASRSPRKPFNMPPKHKRSSVAAATGPEGGFLLSCHEAPISLSTSTTKTPAPKRRASRRGKLDTNPDHNADIVDGKTALRARPDADEKGEALEVGKVNNSPKIPAKKTA
jgi:UV DNA damage endonuclease